MTRKIVSFGCQPLDVHELYMNAICMPAWVTRKPRRESCYVSLDEKPELHLFYKLAMKILLDITSSQAGAWGLCNLSGTVIRLDLMSSLLLWTRSISARIITLSPLLFSFSHP